MTVPAEDDGDAGAFEVLEGEAGTEDDPVVLKTLPNMGFRRSNTNYTEGSHWKTAEEWREVDEQTQAAGQIALPVMEHTEEEIDEKKREIVELSCKVHYLQRENSVLKLVVLLCIIVAVIVVLFN